jgi:K+-transporting ATPase ATPase C chain
MPSIFRPALILFGALTAVCCVAYPLAVTAIGKAVFSDQAEGSLVARNGVAVGQSFSSPHYFWSRPSATGPMPNNAGASSGSNQGPLNPALIDAVKGRIDALRALEPGNTAPIPVDLVTASGSGLDPEISVAAAQYQAGRVAASRKIAPQQVRALIDRHTQHQLAGFFGEARVNVLTLNLALDAQSMHTR